jgi:hypothetical protein
MLRSLAAAVVAVVASSSLANAQTIYAPVQYQYGEGRHKYFYGGEDPAVFDRAERQRAFDDLTDIPHTATRYNYAYVHHNLIGQLTRVYSDVVPYMNARVFGYLPVDASNDAYASAPRYFRKADLDRAAVELPDGSRVVPPAARPVVDPDEVAARRAAAATRPAATTKPRAIIIIPKGNKAKASDKAPVALAR